MDYERVISDARAIFGDATLTRVQREAVMALVAAAEWGFAAERALEQAVIDAQRRIQDVPNGGRENWFAGVKFMCERQAELHRANLPQDGQLGLL